MVVKMAGCNKYDVNPGQIDNIRRLHLIVPPICHIPPLESQHKPHKVRDIPQPSPARSLFACHADINQDPKDETSSEFIERLYVEIPDGGIKLVTNEELKGQLCNDDEMSTECTYIEYMVSSVSAES